MSVPTKIIAPVASEMEAFNRFFKDYLKSNTRILNIITRYILKTKGKQMRPLLVFLSAKLTGDIRPSTHHAASLIELMHTATLIHDDVVDDSDMRRGFFSINAVWKNKVAVLIGDYLLAKGLLLAVDKSEHHLLQIVSDAVKEMSEGELLQIEKARKLDIDEELYFEIIRKKTAVLIAACASAGAASSGSDAATIEKLRLFGEHLGIAFQIRDDLFDFFAGNKTGKPFGNDLREKKITLPLIHALRQAETSEKKNVMRIIRQKNIEADSISNVVEFIRKYKGFDYAEEKMEFFRKSAVDILLSFPQNDAREALETFVDYTITREK